MIEAGSPLQASGRIGQYELIRELGRGGMGTVFLARDTRLGRRVAIKLLHRTQPELGARFILEARATAKFSHENIVVIHEVGECDGKPFMVLEYLQGSPLEQLLRQRHKFSPRRAIEIVVSVVRALDQAHKYGIVHRDLKPDNIFITESGTVKVLDFGIAKLMQGGRASGPARSLAASMVLDLSDARADAEELDDPGSHQLTQKGALVGTLPYMSPEQWGVDTIDHRSDLWAVGIILFEMVAGKHPLDPLRGRQLIVTADLDRPMPSARATCPGIPMELAAVIDRCLEKRKDRRIGSARELLDALEPLLPGQRTPALRGDENPYAGLSSFQEADANRFFGRKREIEAALARLRTKPLLGVAGSSGVGKSSFVRAGVVPALKQSGESWSTLVVRPGREPVAALAQAIAPMVTQSSRSVSDDLSEVNQLHALLYVEPGKAGAVLRSRARRSGEKILLFVDQFEELYTLVPSSDERKAFTACLASVADDATAPLRVIISLRSDFLDRVSEDEHFMAELIHGLFFLKPPDRAGLRDALIQPAEMAHYRFESSEMIENMLDHLDQTPGALPLLQFAANKLWDTRDTGRKLLTETSYREIGGIAGALATHADAILAKLPSSSQGLARALFLRLVTPERTRAIVAEGELRELAPNPGDIQRLIDYLVQARLLTLAGDAEGVASVEIVHESLIHSWPLLRRWLDENQDDARFLEHLRNVAKQWLATGHASGVLWRGEAMQEARRWYRGYRGTLPELQQAYLDAVFALAKRTARRKRWIVAGTMAFLVALVAAACVALVVIRDAEKEATAQAVRIAAQLEEIEQEKREKKRAVTTAVVATEKVNQKEEELRRKNRALREALMEREGALRKSERHRRRARRARRQAERAAAVAVAAEDRALEANRMLEEQLEKERLRNERLRDTLSAVLPDIEVE